MLLKLRRLVQKIPLIKFLQVNFVFLVFNFSGTYVLIVMEDLSPLENLASLDGLHSVSAPSSSSHGSSFLSAYTSTTETGFSSSTERISQLSPIAPEFLSAFGTKIDEYHANYVLMYDMLMGIRIAVSRNQAKEPRKLCDADFKASHKLAFDM